MVFDWDDHGEKNDAMPWMLRLKEMRPDFKATLFAVPTWGSAEFWDGHPDWVELAVHGWTHSSVYECADWSAEYLNLILDDAPERFVNGFKAPGWQISDGCYQALLERGWWVADQHLEDERRPKGLPVFYYEDGNYHGHVQNWGSNGLEEDWNRVIIEVASAKSFEFASEAARLPDYSEHP